MDNKTESQEPKKITTTESSNKTIVSFLANYLKLKYKDRLFNKYLYVSVNHQRLCLIDKNFITKEYSISTAKKGIGNKQDSYQTPLGLHIIKRKIGAKIPFGGIMEARIYGGKVAKVLTKKKKTSKDYVTSRIMWLQGEEPGINKGKNIGSYSRYIYIHGTAEEGFIGQPSSLGCIRMKNTDVIELFDLVDEGTPVLILKD